MNEVNDSGSVESASEASPGSAGGETVPEPGEGRPAGLPATDGYTIGGPEVEKDIAKMQDENGSGGKGDDSLASKFNTAAADKRPAPPVTTGTEGGGQTAKGAGSDLSGGPVIDQTFTGTERPLKEDEPIPNYPGVKFSENPDAKDRNVNRPKGPKP